MALLVSSPGLSSNEYNRAKQHVFLLEDLMRGFVGIDAQRDLIGNRDAVAF